MYRFIESYDRLGVNYKVSEQYSDFSEKEMDEITDTLFINYVTLKGKNIAGDIKEELKVYKPKVITSMDDEIFVYGPLVNTPISFVRIDDAYKQYLESKINKDLPEYPTKQERDYYADEYDERRQIKEEIAQLEALQRRKERDNRRFEYNVKLILRQRERARLELEEKLLAAIAKEEANKLAKVRGEIAAASLEHIKEGKQKLSDNLSMVESKYREPELDEIIISEDILKAAKQKKNQKLMKNFKIIYWNLVLSQNAFNMILTIVKKARLNSIRFHLLKPPLLKLFRKWEVLKNSQENTPRKC